MKINNILLPSLAAGLGLVVFRALSAKTTKRKSASDQIDYNPINAYVIEQMQRLHIPGATLAIVQGDEIVYQRGFGRSRPSGEAPTALTPYFIGSLTKSITAMAVMQLVEAGKVELDAPVQRYLPWFRVADPKASAEVTVRHLLNQTSGFPFLASNVVLAELDDTTGAAERQVRAMSSLKLHHPAGEAVEYCNLNYNVLGLVIEAVSGESYPGYIQKHIFDPLGMSHSYTSKATAQYDGLAPGYRHWFGFPFPAGNLPVPLGSLASGQLISCAEDMAHYLIAHLNGGQYGEAKILSAAGIDALHHGEKEYITFGFSAGRYAMGWFDRDIGSIRTLSHGGNVPDFSAFMALIPQQKKGFVVLFNADPYGLPMITDEVGFNLTTILAGQHPQPVKLDFIQWLFRLLPLIPLLQLWGIITTYRNLKQWQRHPTSRPSWRRLWIEHILLSLVPNLALAAVLAYLRSSRLIKFMDLFMPDMALIARISGGIAGIGASVRTRLLLGYYRKLRA
jgi:CubicO group peptidase (beta-lactamase class C family)